MDVLNGNTPRFDVVSGKQQGLMGAELARRREGEKPRMKGMTEAELESHLKESGGKKLPKKSKRNLRYG